MELDYDQWLTVDPPVELDVIKEIIPHRKPMLWLDRIETFTRNESIAGYIDLLPDAPVFKGHFPDYPVFPGVLQAEAVAQVAACLAILSDPHLFWRKALLLMSLDKVKFRAGAFPGQRLQLEASVLRIRGPIWRFAGKASVDGSTTTQLEFMATVTEMPEKT